MSNPNLSLDEVVKGLKDEGINPSDFETFLTHIGYVCLGCSRESIPLDEWPPKVRGISEENIKKIADYVIKVGLVEQSETGYKIRDPLLLAWVHINFLYMATVSALGQK
mgnify:CR=1 FL=1